MESEFNKLSPMLRTFRNALGLKQKEMADELGMEQYYYASVERGERVPSRDKLMDICSYFDITLNDIATYSGEESTFDRDAIMEGINQNLSQCNNRQLTILNAFIRDILPLM